MNEDQAHLNLRQRSFAKQIRRREVVLKFTVHHSGRRIMNCNMFTIHYSQFTIHYSGQIVNCNLFTIHYSQFTIHYSGQIVNCYLFTIHYSQFTFHYSGRIVNCNLFYNSLFTVFNSLFRPNNEL